MYLLIMRYWYLYTREIHSPVQYIMHCGDLVSLQFLFGTSIKLQRRINYNWERGQVATMLSTHNAWKTTLDYEFLSYTSTNKACSASKYYSETLTLTLISTLTRRYINSVLVRVCGMCLLLMRYWYLHTREMQYIKHCGYLALWGLGLSPISIWYVVKTSTTYKLQLGERPSHHNATYPQCMQNCIELWISLVYEYQ